VFPILDREDALQSAQASPMTNFTHSSVQPPAHAVPEFPIPDRQPASLDRGPQMGRGHCHIVCAHWFVTSESCQDLLTEGPNALAQYCVGDQGRCWIAPLAPLAHP
jgi:hypothetical protein